ncbi:MAG: cysteine hydrolase [Alphaproteobacteria bacterium]|nr:cysteine hydrolase [Alphaproteobacteria bacterium]
MAYDWLDRATEERILWLRGRLHPYDRLDPVRTALVVVDMQDFFCSADAPYGLAEARAIVPAINRLAGALRREGGCVAWVSMVYDPGDPWSNFYDSMLAPARADALKRGLRPESRHYGLYTGLDVKDGDIMSVKRRFSAFLPGYCHLADRLRVKDIDTVLITGTLTNTCCETSARDAMMLGFRTVMVADGCAAAVAEAHAATLRNFLQVSGDVRTTAEILALIAARETAAAQ